MDFKLLPKVELHCHLDGSLRPETIIDIAKKENIEIPSYNINDIKKLIIAPLECKSLEEYITRFQIPIMVMQSKESLSRVAFELFEDAAEENIKYLEVRFAPLQHVNKGLTTNEVIESVLEGIKAGEELYDIKGNIILSFLKNVPEETIFEVIEEAAQFLNQGVVAVDLAGAEDEGFSLRFIEAAKKAVALGYKLTIHAGENGIGKNVLEAIELLGAERIGHGIYIKNCPTAYEIVKSKGITLEVCPTSNIQTKAVKSLKEHPFYEFLKDGIKVTMNTDNRTVSNTTLTRELQEIDKEFHLTFEDYKNIYLNSVEAAFIDEETKKALRALI